MAKFYDHPQTGRLHFQAPAGGTGGGATSEWDAPATEADIRDNPREHSRYLKEKRDAVSARDAQAQAIEKAAQEKAQAIVAQAEVAAAAAIEASTKE